MRSIKSVGELEFLEFTKLTSCPRIVQEFFQLLVEQLYNEVLRCLEQSEI